MENRKNELIERELNAVGENSPKYQRFLEYTKTCDDIEFLEACVVADENNTKIDENAVRAYLTRLTHAQSLKNWNK